MLLTSNNTWGWYYDNYNTAAPDTPVTTIGSALTSGSGTKGSWVQVSNGTLPQQVWAALFSFGATGVANSIRAHVADIGVDPAGGTSYSVVASNILCGHRGVSGNNISQYLHIGLPLSIPAGATVAVRMAGSGNITGDTIRAAARFFGQPSRPESVWSGTFCESVGIANDGSYPTNAAGTEFTPGNSGAWGSWTSLGTTSARLRHANLCVQARNSTMAALSYWFELGWGDATTPVPIVQRLPVVTGTTEAVVSPQMDMPCDIPSGATVYVRGTCSGTADTGWSAMMIGVG